MAAALRELAILPQSRERLASAAAEIVAERYGVPFEATRGGPETMYPEYRNKLKGATAKLVNASR